MKHFLNALRGWLGGRPAPRRRPGDYPFRPLLEGLETRYVLSSADAFHLPLPAPEMGEAPAIVWSIGLLSPQPEAGPQHEGALSDAERPPLEGAAPSETVFPPTSNAPNDPPNVIIGEVSANAGPILGPFHLTGQVGKVELSDDAADAPDDGPGKITTPGPAWHGGALALVFTVNTGEVADVRPVDLTQAQKFDVRVMTFSTVALEPPVVRLIHGEAFVGVASVFRPSVPAFVSEPVRYTATIEKLADPPAAAPQARGAFKLWGFGGALFDLAPRGLEPYRPAASLESHPAPAAPARAAALGSARVQADDPPGASTTAGPPSGSHSPGESAASAAPREQASAGDRHSEGWQALALGLRDAGRQDGWREVGSGQPGQTLHLVSPSAEGERPTAADAGPTIPALRVAASTADEDAGPAVMIGIPLAVEAAMTRRTATDADHSFDLLNLRSRDGGIDSLAPFLTQAVAYLGGLRGGAEAEKAGAMLQPTADSKMLLADVVRRVTERFTTLVHRLYLVFLGRDPNPDEEQGWVQLLVQGHTEEAVLGAMLGTGEFYDRAVAQGGDGSADERFLRGLFRTVLGRFPEEPEVVTWLVALPSMGRSGVATFLLRSHEYRALVVDELFRACWGRPGEPEEVLAWARSPLALGSIREAFEARQGDGVASS